MARGTDAVVDEWNEALEDWSMQIRFSMRAFWFFTGKKCRNLPEFKQALLDWRPTAVEAEAANNVAFLNLVSAMLERDLKATELWLKHMPLTVEPSFASQIPLMTREEVAEKARELARELKISEDEALAYIRDETV